jgi:phage terminase large subunit
MTDIGFPQIVEWWQKEPVVFIKEILGIDLCSYQADIAESVRDNDRTSVRSASAVGKTLIGACIVLWFLSSFKPSTVLTTGKSYRQVREQLWREISTRHSQAKIPIGGKIVMSPYPRLDLADDWFAIGFATDEAERWTGFHNKYVLEIIDEASGIPEDVYGSLENPLAAGYTRQLLMGNPTQSVGKFRDSFASSAYKAFHISAFDTPAFTNEGDFPYLISKKYVEERRVEWGEDNPLYEVYIKGDFPSGETDRLIPFGLAEAAIHREIKPDKEDLIAIGVDTARFGDDENALYVRKGGKVIERAFWKKCDTEATIGHIVHILGQYENAVVNIDEGYNPGVVDGLKALKHKVNGISFQGKPRNTKLYANIRAEMFWNLADKFKAGDIQIPNDKLLLKQLTDIKKKPLNRYDQIIIESKDEMKARGLKSPDRADALALCFMNPRGREVSIRWI